jgi:pimeloyl-ACP methyl ester carboxylesterase
VDSKWGPIRGVVFGSGEPLYFLNGWSGTSELFCLTAWLLREQFRCVLVDYPENCNQLDQLAASVMTVADYMGDDRFNLFGTGFGSSVAVEVAAKSPSRIRNLILQAPVISYRLSFLERVCGKLASYLPASWRRVPLRQRLLLSNHRLWFPPIDHTRWQFLADNVQETSLSHVARRFLMLSGLDLWASLAAIECPIVVVTCEGDPKRVRDAGDELARRLPNARVEFISNCGQVPYVTHPHRLANIIKPLIVEPVASTT